MKPTLSHQRKKIQVHLRYQGRHYFYLEEMNAWDERVAFAMARYMYEEGNYACDCNRSRFISWECDNRMPELPCGDTIELISLSERRRMPVNTRRAKVACRRTS